MSKLLINEPPLQVLPTLAKNIGLNEAIVLQQVHYWLGIQQKSQNDFCWRDGKWWVHKTYEEWHEELCWWSLSTVKRTLNSLREAGLLIARELSKNPSDHTLWYTIDYDALNEREKGLFKLNKPPGQNEQIDQVKMNKSTYTETTTETTSDREGADAPAPDNVPEAPSSVHAKQKTLNGMPGPAPEARPAAVEIYRSVHGRYPSKNAWALIDEQVAGRLDAWRQVCEAWILQQNNPTNLQGQLDWLRDGIPDYAKAGGPPRRSSGRQPDVFHGVDVSRVPRAFRGIVESCIEDGIELPPNLQRYIDPPEQVVEAKVVSSR